MAKYRNKVTGAVVDIEGIAKGDWELIPSPSSSVEKPDKKEKTKRKAKKD